MITNPGTSISCRHLSKRFPVRTAVEHIDLEIRPGEAVAIVGRSGCGKSTLLRLLSGLEAPSSGSIHVNGRLLEGINARARVMFQDACLFPWKRLTANVVLGLPSAQHHEGPRALRRVGLEGRERDWPHVLSGGQRQRVSLARALASQPELLLLDEPLGALDALTRLDMQRLIEELWTQQRFTLVLVTHDVDEAVALADRVLVMDRGIWTSSHAVDLERPRDRTCAAFIDLKRRVLASVMGGSVVPAS
jgi:sulfonate transport system ATP-binding protein